ncbi:MULTISPECIES: metallophosphoesterase family protein [unclassified Lysinibacillus]|uniref:metallophosphoesterase family protein n=1 Tax=unclassified Lysinibacillus TaxID=2636778 RepID=UPI0025537E11|nr:MULTISPECIES: metallophosphoesterase family protein [unclassified Lysinibacillus]MDM5248657.1 metallophosphoesterase family protein [Lysinibacillus sp. G4S2]
MRIAIVTDIHGNASALNAVLSDIDSRKDIERIYCLGDMIGIGPDSNEVLQMLFSRNDILIITGNHDEAILALAKGQEYPKSHAHTKEHHQWILDRLDESFIPKLEKLNRTIKENIEGHSILFTHYQIKNNYKNEHISKDPFSSIVTPSNENLEKLFEGNNEKLICFGHHHSTHYFIGNKTIYLNPGSLGCNDKSTAPYAIIAFTNETIEIKLEEATYDNTSFLESYHKLQVPELDFILKVFHGNQL